MNNFNNRIKKQREILKLVNKKNRLSEPLCSLTQSAIQRWKIVNNISPTSPAINLLTTIATKLLVLANCSENQVTEDFSLTMSEVDGLTATLSNLFFDCKITNSNSYILFECN